MNGKNEVVKLGAEVEAACCACNALIDEIRARGVERADEKLLLDMLECLNYCIAFATHRLVYALLRERGHD